MHKEIVAFIRKRNRQEWLAFGREHFESARKWTQVNGEIAAGLAFLAGIAIVLAFQAFLIVLVLLSILAFAVWQIALPESSEGGGESGPSPQ